MQDRLSKLVAIFDGLDFRANRTEGDDLLGDAYEYLMQHFATESGKSKGQFYTPAEVSRIMAKVVGIGPDTRSDHTIYDPTCGSGSLLLKAADEAPGGITVYGQEMDNATWALARMNMILHDHPTAELWRGNREADIRRNLIRRGFIKGIIGLPANLFYGTGIPTCILVIDKAYAGARQGIFMIDASRGFLKEGNKNRLRAQDIHRIVDVFNRQIELPRYSRMVPVAEIAGPANDDNLNIPRYVDSSEPEDLHDLGAHLRGGIPDRDLDALDTYWTVFPSLRPTLFEATINEERDILMRCLALIEADSEAGKAVKGAQAAMDRAVLARYATLTEAEIKTLVVEDKWYASIRPPSTTRCNG